MDVLLYESKTVRRHVRGAFVSSRASWRRFAILNPCNKLQLFPECVPVFFRHTKSSASASVMFCVIPLRQGACCFGVLQGKGQKVGEYG
jgi:hypothetical protein